MAFRRPPSAFRNTLGSAEFPFETDRYLLYVAMGCPWATGALMAAKLKKLIGPGHVRDFIEGVSPIQSLESDSQSNKGNTNYLKVCVVHPTWQLTDPEEDMKSSNSNSEAKAAGVQESCHAGWVFAEKNQPIIPVAVMRNGKDFGLNFGATAEEICLRYSKMSKSESDQGPGNTNSAESEISIDILNNHGIKSKSCTLDLSRHKCPTLRHLYERSGGYMSEGVRATTPMLYDTKTDKVVSNESTDILKFFNEWGNVISSESEVLDIYPKSLQVEIEKTTEWVYGINNGVYRCGFANSQPAYDEAAILLEERMNEVESYLATKNNPNFLVGEQLTTVDIRLFNTLMRFDEVYTVYFKCGFGSLISTITSKSSLDNSNSDSKSSSINLPGVKFPHLLKFTANLWNSYPEFRDSFDMDDVRNHYFSSHAIRNMYGIVPKEIGFIKVLESI